MIVLSTHGGRTVTSYVYCSVGTYITLILHVIHILHVGPSISEACATNTSPAMIQLIVRHTWYEGNHLFEVGVWWVHSMESSQLHNILPTCFWVTFSLNVSLREALDTVWDRVRSTIVPFPKSIFQDNFLVIELGNINNDCWTLCDLHWSLLTNFGCTDHWVEENLEYTLSRIFCWWILKVVGEGCRQYNHSHPCRDVIHSDHVHLWFVQGGSSVV